MYADLMVIPMREDLTKVGILRKLTRRWERKKEQPY